MALVTVWRGRSLGVCTLLISVCFDGGPVHRVCLPVLVDKTRHVKVTPQKQAHGAVLPAQNWGHFPKSGLRSLRYSPLRPHAGSNVCCTEQLGSPRDSCSHAVTRQDASREGGAVGSLARVPADRGSDLSPVVHLNEISESLRAPGFPCGRRDDRSTRRRGVVRSG